jgi:hypothetical protein
MTEQRECKIKIKGTSNISSVIVLRSNSVEMAQNFSFGAMKSWI